MSIFHNNGRILSVAQNGSYHCEFGADLRIVLFVASTICCFYVRFHTVLIGILDFETNVYFQKSVQYIMQLHHSTQTPYSINSAETSNGDGDIDCFVN